MKNLIIGVNNVSYWLMLLFALLFVIGWLFNCNVDRIGGILNDIAFTYLVTWFINLLFIKK